ncbi:hypothetical protein E2562_011944 [Oryza meyeriana var. granulata]|uniref:Uncharacterized protein n=1 Tax=Oryza meyeriana var. granulata TaxID=110450 RepID=A0A6G1F6T6_9ORYZ|nr:hypothetical protein E2562_011944 [Oryza meyeriana var. granulata]
MNNALVIFWREVSPANTAESQFKQQKSMTVMATRAISKAARNAVFVLGSRWLKPTALVLFIMKSGSSAFANLSPLEAHITNLRNTGNSVLPARIWQETNVTLQTSLPEKTSLRL